MTIADDIIHFEEKTLSKIKTSNRALFKLIFTILLGIIFVYLSGFWGRNSEKVDLAFKLLMPTVLIIGVAIYLLYSKVVSSITFNKTENRITINYYKLFKERSISFGFNEFKYHIEEMRTSLYSSKKMQTLKLTLRDNTSFTIAVKPSENSMDFDNILKTIQEIKAKK